MMLKSINPATLEIVGQVPTTSPSDVYGLCEKSYQEFLKWRSEPLRKRKKVLDNFKQLLIQNGDKIGALITSETGRPFAESMVLELAASIDLTAYYVRKADRFLTDRRVPLHHLFFKRRKSAIHFQPLGVMGVISTWNWPLLIPLGSIVPALLAGNTVVFKSSELTPLTGDLIQTLFIEAGLPKDALIMLHGNAEVGEALIRSPIEKIFFTGSTHVGQKIMHQASQKLLKVVLEMGGHDPAIVCEDADLENTSSGILWGGFNNCGQNCNSVERIYVHRTVTEEFREKLIHKVQKLKAGDGMEQDTDIGPLASGQQLEKISAYVTHAEKNGAKIFCGGNSIPDKKGYFYEPTVLLWPENTDCMSDNEIFGPVVSIHPVSDHETAVRLSNQSVFGLAASVWTQNLRLGEHIAHKLEAGSVMINDAVVSFGIPEAGWTGVKKSGVGWVHGEKGLDEMINMQYINIQKQTYIQQFWWFPYSSKTIAGIRSGIRFLYENRPLQRVSGAASAVLYFWRFLLLNRRVKDKY